MARLGFLTIRARHPEASAAFYGVLGFVFQPERHGQGPWHMASTGEGPVLEIYPAGVGDGAGSALIGIEIGSAQALSALRPRLEALGGACIAPPAAFGAASARMIFRDPDGHQVMIVADRA